jgi:hypothetical protein
MYEEQLEELKGITELTKILSYKINEKYNQGFTAISKHDDKIAMGNPTVIRNFLMSSMMMLNFKIRERKEYAFRSILKEVGLNSVS